MRQKLPSSESREQVNAAFTLVELLVIISVLALLAMLLTPALARTRVNDRAFQCQNNLRQLINGWRMYAEDNADRVINNFGVSELLADISNNNYRNWANNVMSWNSDQMNTNISLLLKGIMAPYLGSNVTVYRCPADNYLSAAQRASGWTARLRSYSMNAYFGSYNPTWTSEANIFFPEYRQFLKLSSIPNPSGLFVFVEEHPDSINDGYFLNNADKAAFSYWGDFPASYHNGAGSFAFADGHSEIYKWRSKVTILPVKFTFGPQLQFSSDPPFGSMDAEWITSRTSVRR